MILRFVIPLVKNHGERNSVDNHAQDFHDDTGHRLVIGSVVEENSRRVKIGLVKGLVGKSQNAEKRNLQNCGGNKEWRLKVEQSLQKE